MTLIREQDLLAQIEALKARVKALETNNRLASGTLRKVTVVADDGTVIGEIGALNVPDPEGNRQSGFVFRRDDGLMAFSLFDPLPTVNGFNQFWALWDRSKNLIMSDDTTSGVGLARPYIPFLVANTDQSTWPGPTTTSFADMFFSYFQKQHPYVEVWAQVSVSASTTAEVQLVQGDTVLGDVVTVDPGFDYVSWKQAVDGDFGDMIDIHIAARRPTGTGSVKIQVVGAWGRQTP